jgi:hypothetical protein
MTYGRVEGVPAAGSGACVCGRNQGAEWIR